MPETEKKQPQRGFSDQEQEKIPPFAESRLKKGQMSHALEEALNAVERMGRKSVH